MPYTTKDNILCALGPFHGYVKGEEKMISVKLHMLLLWCLVVAASLKLLSFGGFFEADLEMEMRLSFLHNSNMEIERENFIFWIMLNMIKNHVFHHIIS